MENGQVWLSSGLRSLTIGSMWAALNALVFGASGYGGGSGGGPSGRSGQALWVPNLEVDFVSEFTSSMLKKSGTPRPAGVNLTADLDEPWGEVFDSTKPFRLATSAAGRLPCSPSPI